MRVELSLRMFPPVSARLSPVGGSVLLEYRVMNVCLKVITSTVSEKVNSSKPALASN